MNIKAKIVKSLCRIFSLKFILNTGRSKSFQLDINDFERCHSTSSMVLLSGTTVNKIFHLFQSAVKYYIYIRY